MRLLGLALIVIPLAVMAIGFLGLNGGTFTVTFLVEGLIGQFDTLPKFLVDGVMVGGGLLILLANGLSRPVKPHAATAPPEMAAVEAPEGSWRCRCGQINEEALAECPSCKRTAAAVM